MEQYIFWILIIAYLAHVMEEYYFNWKEWVYTLTGINIPWYEFSVINFIVIIYGICIAMIGIKNLYISLTFPALMIINAVIFHIIPTLFKRKISPGVFTSVILFLPLSIMTFYKLNQINKLEKNNIIIAFVGGLIIMLYPIILNRIREKLKIRKKNKNIEK
jgi:hypothetical protein